LKKNDIPMIKRMFVPCVLAVMAMILGFLLTLQIRSVYKVGGGSTAEIVRAQDLQKQLSAEIEKNRALLIQVADLNAAVSEYRNTADVNAALSRQLHNAEILAGLTDVSGPGVVVTMKDSIAAEAQGDDSSAFVIHDADILQVLNELRDAGVDAMSINEERILANSEVRCAGNVVSINNNRYAAPYVIKAVGDPDKLKAALLMKDGIVELLGRWGIEVNIQTSQKITVRAYQGTPSFKYASSGGK
jgi:uncharacterized protein YlxW (UPF0749 family)